MVTTARKDDPKKQKPKPLHEIDWKYRGNVDLDRNVGLFMRETFEGIQPPYTRQDLKITKSFHYLGMSEHFLDCFRERPLDTYFTICKDMEREFFHRVINCQLLWEANRNG